MTTTKHALVNTLIECGATHIYAPRPTHSWMLDEFYEKRDDLNVVLTRSNSIAATMA